MHYRLIQQAAAEHQRDLRRQADARRLQQQARRGRAPAHIPLQVRLGWFLVALGLRLTLSRGSSAIAVPQSRHQFHPGHEEFEPAGRPSQPSRQLRCPCR